MYTAQQLDRIAPLMGLEPEDAALAALKCTPVLQLSSADIVRAMMCLQCAPFCTKPLTNQTTAST